MTRQTGLLSVFQEIFSRVGSYQPVQTFQALPPLSDLVLGHSSESQQIRLVSVQNRGTHTSGYGNVQQRM
jgi:hypothetical protein